jgi:hypothetical protein
MIRIRVRAMGRIRGKPLFIVAISRIEPVIVSVRKLPIY